MKKKKEKQTREKVSNVTPEASAGLLNVLHMIGHEDLAGGPDRDTVNNDRVRRLFNQLSETDHIILSLRFGLDGEGKRTLQEIGEIVGMTPQSVDYRLRKLAKNKPLDT